MADTLIVSSGTVELHPENEEISSEVIHITLYDKMVVRPESPIWRARTAEVSVTLRDVLKRSVVESAGQ